MSKFITSANSMITIVDDASYQLNDALHINAVFTASGVVAATAANQEYNVEGWVKLP